MGSITDRKGLYKPTAGERGYDDEFADSMDTIDADACFKDLQETITAIWTFTKALQIQLATAGPPLELNDAAKGELVTGLNAEQLGGVKKSKLEILHFFFASNQGDGLTYNYIGSDSSSTESHRQMLMPDSQLLGLYVNVTTNSLDGATTIVLRQNGADTALSITVGSGSTGFSSVEDTINFDDRDLFSIEIDTTASTAGSFTFQIRVDYRLT